MKHLNIMVSKHSVFYSPLIAVIAGGFLKEHGYEANYSIVPENETVSTYLLSGEVDVAQAAVSANWSFMEQNKKINIIHFAEVNQRDGFFILSKFEFLIQISRPYIYTSAISPCICLAIL